MNMQPDHRPTRFFDSTMWIGRWRFSKLSDVTFSCLPDLIQVSVRLIAQTHSNFQIGATPDMANFKSIFSIVDLHPNILV